MIAPNAAIPDLDVVTVNNGNLEYINIPLTLNLMDKIMLINANQDGVGIVWLKHRICAASMMYDSKLYQPYFKDSMSMCFTCMLNCVSINMQRKLVEESSGMILSTNKNIKS